MRRLLQLLVLGALALAQRGVSAGRSRHLLASNSSGYDDDHHDDHGDDHHGDDDHGGHGCHDSHAGHHGKYAHFKGMLRCFGFALSVWTSGKLAAGLGIPSLVGEIICGIIIGPHVLEIINHTYDPTASVLILVGEVGLCMHAIEAGLMFDPEMMEVVGPRGLAVGIAGSGLPLALSYAIARGWGASADEAFVVGASMATMSAGITLNVLRTGGVLNQPIGQLRCQLVISAATVNEIMNIILYTEVSNLVYGVPDEPFGSWFWRALPVVTNFVTVGVIGAAGVYVVPHVIEARVTPMIPEEYRQNFLLGLLFVKRVYAFLMKIFFAATVGFHVPLAELFQTGTLAKAALLLPGKGILHQQAYDAVLFVVLLSILLCPYGLRVTLDYAARGASTSRRRSSTRPGADGEAAPAYYCIQTLSKARWDQQTAILSTVTSSDCDIVDHGRGPDPALAPGARQNDEGELSPTASAQELLRETRDARAFTAPVTADEDLAPYHQVRRQSSSMDAEALRLIEVPVSPFRPRARAAAEPRARALRAQRTRRPEPPEPLVKQSSSPSALGAAAAAAAPPPPGLAAADGGFETAAAPYSRLSSIESDGGSARRSSFSSEQGCVLPTRLRRRSSSGKNVELQDRA
ncbi:hypothetical protein SO694_00127044 [Aureococcus anophagefferens]|uniref:Cation/H+ exchanger transmembrane domain-containing protein n=1 Tax=Aureococcus anophagefferens TaxID=44056 RepID=A0ABR1G3J7_AURAN